MKKRNIFVSLLLAITLMITACGQENPFVGSWKGSCDLTDLIIEYVVGENEEIRPYLEGIDDLAFVIQFEFTEDELAMSVNKSSIDTFLTHLEDGLLQMMEELLVDELEKYGISYEEYLLESGMSNEELLYSMLDEMNVSEQMETMMYSMAEALELSGNYMYDEEKITVIYEDGTIEEMDYTFDGTDMIITFVDEAGTEYPIICEK